MEYYKERYQQAKASIYDISESSKCFPFIANILKEYETFIKVFENASIQDEFLRQQIVQSSSINATRKNIDDYKMSLVENLQIIQNNNKRLLSEISEKKQCRIESILRHEALLNVKESLNGKGCSGLTGMQLCSLLQLRPTQWADPTILKQKLSEVEKKVSMLKDDILHRFEWKESYDNLVKTTLQKESQCEALGMINRTLKARVKRIKVAIEAAQISAYHEHTHGKRDSKALAKIVNLVINKFEADVNQESAIVTNKLTIVTNESAIVTNESTMEKGNEAFSTAKQDKAIEKMNIAAVFAKVGRTGQIDAEANQQVECESGTDAVNQQVERESLTNAVNQQVECKSPTDKKGCEQTLSVGDVSLQTKLENIGRPKSFDVKKSFIDDDPLKEQEAEMTMDYVECFSRLFSAKKFEEAAFHAIYSPKGILRTPHTLKYFKDIDVILKKKQPGEKCTLLHYCSLLMSTIELIGKQPTSWETIECFKCAINEDQIDLVEYWIAKDQVTLTEPIGNMLFRSCLCTKGLCCCKNVMLAEVVFKYLKAHHQVINVLLQQGRYATCLFYAKVEAHFSCVDYARLLEEDICGGELAVLLIRLNPLLVIEKIVIELVSSNQDKQAMMLLKLCETNERPLCFQYQHFDGWDSDETAVERFVNVCINAGLQLVAYEFISSYLVYTSLSSGLEASLVSA